LKNYLAGQLTLIVKHRVQNGLFIGKIRLYDIDAQLRQCFGLVLRANDGANVYILDWSGGPGNKSGYNRASAAFKLALNEERLYKS
jgi:hypothetical protein